MVKERSPGSATTAARQTPTAEIGNRAASQRISAAPSAPPPNCPTMIQAVALDWADSDSAFTISPPHAAFIKKVSIPPTRMSTVRRVRCDTASARKYMHTATEVPNVAIASHVLRRNLISTTGANRKPKTPGKLIIELILAIPSTGTPAWASNSGSAVKLKPNTTIPNGKISRLKSQGAGHCFESLMAPHIREEILRLMGGVMRALAARRPKVGVWETALRVNCFNNAYAQNPGPKDSDPNGGSDPKQSVRCLRKKRSQFDLLLCSQETRQLSFPPREQVRNRRGINSDS